MWSFDKDSPYKATEINLVGPYRWPYRIRLAEESDLDALDTLQRKADVGFALKVAVGVWREWGIPRRSPCLPNLESERIYLWKG